MAVTYTSKHHSPEDPGGLIREVLDLGPEFPGPARDVLLTWMMRLDEDADPSAAARALIARYGLDHTPSKAGPCAELVALLRETATYPQERLNSHLCRPRRRGGPARRRESD